jgi:hypothetical protein
MGTSKERGQTTTGRESASKLTRQDFIVHGSSVLAAQRSVRKALSAKQ